MNQKVALVTGAGSGMGASTAERFAREGIAVGVLDINYSAAKSVEAEIVKKGGKAIALEADVSNQKSVITAVNALRKELGGITVLVNNAAVEEFCPFESITEASWDKIMDVNLKGVYLVTQAVLPDMVNSAWGRIINIGAFGAQMSTPSMGHYYASKGGMFSLTRCLAAELGSKGITVNTVSPGFIDTPMARRAIEEGKFPVAPEIIYGAYPIPRMGKPEEIAAACAFLASEDAGYITAQLLGVNGGAVV
ncbi:3-oxoacyl-ACP reductase family protein [Halioxenophilus sp. WMMB6]|uniref:SDR family NAD(P)-dependent oxidoreductase n=1 Tax=Halioxenophilus sp. WMMB6 TaxID=3073815 RepID=UPI00295EC5BA|nr:3-oxoacyl-ACP reductase family protein [Halioxenophilus sp. WMMB6]